MKILKLGFCLLLLAEAGLAQQQVDTSKRSYQYKNVVRYNLSGALFFGFDKYIVFGYERVLTPRSSMSINFGRASLPRIVDIITDSFSSNKDIKRSGFNASIDYRFYLAKENKFEAPHGVYIGPYYSFNHFTGERQWSVKNNASTHFNSTTDFSIHTVGFELGYQFILWKRVALDFVLAGPGLGFYKYQATFDTNLDPAKQEQLFEALSDMLTDKFPGMNYVFSGEEFNANGVMRTNTIGYRYIVHIGFAF